MTVHLSTLIREASDCNRVDTHSWSTYETAEYSSLDGITVSHPVLLQDCRVLISRRDKSIPLPSSHGSGIIREEGAERLLEPETAKLADAIETVTQMN